MTPEHPVRSHRRALGLTQAELAHLARCKHATISRVENGNLDVSVGLKVRLARALGVSVQQLWEPVDANPGTEKQTA